MQQDLRMMLMVSLSVADPLVLTFDHRLRRSRNLTVHCEVIRKY